MADSLLTTGVSASRKVCVVTGTRAEYGLLYWLIRGLKDNPAFDLQLVVTGMHLSPEFGLTVRQIEADGLPITRRVEMLLSSDTPVGITKSMGLGQIGFADVWADLQPDLIVVLGDRFEILAAVSAALVFRIPVAHLNGGETTEGAFDESVRHAITKMAHLHFTATEPYRQRVVQLGENPARVFNVGSMGIENINRLTLLDRAAFEESIGFTLGKRNLLVTFHPVTLETGTATAQMEELLAALDALPDTHLIITKPNADTDGRGLIDQIDAFVARRPQTAAAFISLGQLRYLSALRHVDGVVGNSSSGLAEAPSFRIGTVNVGDRQKGRLQAASVINCDPTRASIGTALDTLYSSEFQAALPAARNPYGDASPSAEILDVLRTVELAPLLKKHFYDLTAASAAVVPAIA